MHDRLPIPPTLSALKAIHIEAEDLELRAAEWFGRHAQKDVGLHERRAASREWLKLLTRLMRVMVWLQAQSGIASDAKMVRCRESVVAGTVQSVDTDFAMIPTAAQVLILESVDLYAKVRRFEAVGEVTSPARQLQQYLISLMQQR